MEDILRSIDIIYTSILGINCMTILGSVLSFIIFSRKAFEKSSIGFYCRFLAVFDLFVIYNFGLGLATTTLKTSFISKYDIICKLAFFISSGVSSIPGWILVVFSFDQLIIVSRTERFQFFKKRWFQYSIILTIFLVQCSIFIVTFFSNGIVYITIQDFTFPSCESFSLAMPIVYLVEASLFPFVLIIISMFFVVRGLIKSRQKIVSIQQTNVRRNRDCKFAFNSVILNLLFILFTFPLIVYYIIPRGDYFLFSLINAICFIFYYLNFALHFWVHLAFNSIFRKELLIFFRIVKRN